MRIRNVQIGQALGLTSSGQKLAAGLADLGVPGYHADGGISALSSSSAGLGAAALSARDALVKSMEDAKTKLIAINDQLYKSLAALQDANSWYNLGITQQLVDSAGSGVDNWHNGALRWMNDLGPIEGAIQSVESIEDVGSSLQDEIKRSMKTAALLSKQGIDLTSMIRDDASVSAFQDFVRHTAEFVPLYFDFIRGLPGKTVDEAGKLIHKVVDVVDDTASGLTWAAVKPFVLAGSAIALVAFLLVKSGVKLNVPFVKLGA